MLCIARIMLSQDVCPSVCLFVRHTPVSVETSLHIIKLFSPLGSHTTLLLQYQTLRQYFDGDRPPPPTGTSNKGVWKNRIFDLSHCILETIQDTAIVTMLQAFEWYYFQWPQWLSEIFNGTKHRATSMRRASCHHIWHEYPKDKQAQLHTSISSWSSSSCSDVLMVILAAPFTMDLLHSHYLGDQ